MSQLVSEVKLREEERQITRQSQSELKLLKTSYISFLPSRSPHFIHQKLKHFSILYS